MLVMLTVISGVDDDDNYVSGALFTVLVMMTLH